MIEYVFILATWRKSIIERFKNSRRGGTKRTNSNDGGYSAKAPRLEEEISEKEYETAVTNLKKEFKRKNPRMGVVQELMDATRQRRRRKWINSAKTNSL